MPGMNLFHCTGEIQSMNGLFQRTIYICMRKHVLRQLVSDVGTEAVAGDAITSDAEKYKFLPVFLCVQNTFF